MIDYLVVPRVLVEGHGDLTGSPFGFAALALLCLAYVVVPFEHTLHLRKSKPVLVAAGLIWILVAMAFSREGQGELVRAAVEHNLTEYAELLLFLLTAMTFINSLQERNVFQALRAFLVSRGLSLRKVFWVTGALAFVISPVADNLTTALIMGAVVMAVAGSNRPFVVVSCVNIVVAANAGGAFSPFGDITTLMVWQSDKVAFGQFMHLFPAALVNWLVPAAIMSRTIGPQQPEAVDEKVVLKYGAIAMTLLFLLTIAIAVCFHSVLDMPPSTGMMLGLGLLGLLSYHVKIHEGRDLSYDAILGASAPPRLSVLGGIINDRVVLAQLVEERSLPAFAIDGDHRVTHWNAAMAELTGVPTAEMVGSGRHRQALDDGSGGTLADLIVDGAGDADFELRHPDRVKPNAEMADAYDSVGHIAGLPDWYAFAAAPVRDDDGHVVGAIEVMQEVAQEQREAAQFDLMRTVSRAEWDTLLFFYGVILAVGGVAQFGYLAALSSSAYGGLGPTGANVAVGFLSAVVDNIPVMFAVLTMDPDMSTSQWLLVTLTAGVGGSMLSIGSAAGVALMGTARGMYTFGSHLRWTPAIALGYAASVALHLLINGR